MFIIQYDRQCLDTAIIIHIVAPFPPPSSLNPPPSPAPLLSDLNPTLFPPQPPRWTQTLAQAPLYMETNYTPGWLYQLYEFNLSTLTVWTL